VISMVTIVITFFCLGSAPNNTKSQKYRLQFDISPLPEREKVKAAEVRFTMFNNTELQDDEFIQILIHDIIRPGRKGQSKPILRYIYILIYT